MIRIYHKGIQVAYTCITFPGGERHIRISDNFEGSATISARINSSDNIMDLLLITDALRRMKVNELHLQIPYLPYARQDRVGESNFGEALSVKVMADLINSQNYASVKTLDCHSNVGAALINNCTNESNLSFVKKAIGVGLANEKLSSDYLLVSPDAGALKKIGDVANYMHYDREIAIGFKRRNMATGEITGTFVFNGEGIEGHDVLIIDDICDGGKTFIELAKVLKAKGAYRVILMVTHGIFSKGIDVLIDEGIDHIFCTDSFKQINHLNVTQYKII